MEKKGREKTLVYVKIKTKVAIMRTLLYTLSIVEQAVAKPIYFVKKKKSHPTQTWDVSNYVQINSYIPFLECRLFLKLFSLYYYVIVSKSSLL